MPGTESLIKKDISIISIEAVTEYRGDTGEQK